MDDQTRRQTDHIRRKHEFDGIADPDEVRTLIDGAAIDETNAQIPNILGQLDCYA